jgi:hypothetical protein
MRWKPLRGAPSGLPGERGRYLLVLGPPLIEDGPRWVHFSWRGESFCIRDFIGGRKTRHSYQGDTEPRLTAAEIWRQATKVKRATGDLFHKANDLDWWTETLKSLPMK